MMISRRALISLCLVVLVSTPLLADGLAIRGGKVLTMDDNDTILNNAVVLVKDGKIEALGPTREMRIPDGYRVIDASDRWVFPGIVEGHSHAPGFFSDLHDYVWLANPGLRALEATDLGNETILTGVQVGITTVLVIPGSGSNMGGLGFIAKSMGRSVEEAAVQQPGTLKVAQAGNPERYWFGVGRSYMNYNTRQTMQKAKDYHQRWLDYESGKTKEKPEFILVWDQLRGLFKREFPVSNHTQIYQVFLKTITMFNDELGIWVVPFHSSFDSYKTAELIAERNMAVNNGPRQLMFDWNQRAIFGHCQRWWQGGVRRLSVNTDAPVVPQHELTFQAAMAVRLGWETYPALRGITIEVAKAFGVDERVGSIEIGKDGDFGIWTGNPIDPRSACEMTLIEGDVVYDSSKVRRRRF